MHQHVVRDRLALGIQSLQDAQRPFVLGARDAAAVFHPIVQCQPRRGPPQGQVEHDRGTDIDPLRGWTNEHYLRYHAPSHPGLPAAGATRTMPRSCWAIALVV